MRREIKSLSHFFGITAQRREQGGWRGSEEAEACTQHCTSPIITLFFSPLDHDDHCSPLFQWLYLGPQPRYINLLVAPPSPPLSKSPTDALQSTVAITVCSSANWFLPRHKTNFFMPPPLCSKPSLHEQPSFLPALLPNSSKKRPQRFRGRKVSIWFVICIFVCKKYY
jgi:hypothetical protein